MWGSGWGCVSSPLPTGFPAWNQRHRQAQQHNRPTTHANLVNPPVLPGSAYGAGGPVYPHLFRQPAALSNALCGFGPHNPCLCPSAHPKQQPTVNPLAPPHATHTPHVGLQPPPTHTPQPPHHPTHGAPTWSTRPPRARRTARTCRAAGRPCRRPHTAPPARTTSWRGPAAAVRPLGRSRRGRCGRAGARRACSCSPAATAAECRWPPPLRIEGGSSRARGVWR